MSRICGKNVGSGAEHSIDPELHQSWTLVKAEGESENFYSPQRRSKNSHHWSPQIPPANRQRASPITHGAARWRVEGSQHGFYQPLASLEFVQRCWKVSNARSSALECALSFGRSWLVSDKTTTPKVLLPLSLFGDQLPSEGFPFRLFLHESHLGRCKLGRAWFNKCCCGFFGNKQITVGDVKSRIKKESAHQRRGQVTGEPYGFAALGGVRGSVECVLLHTVERMSMCADEQEVCWQIYALPVLTHASQARHTQAVAIQSNRNLNVLQYFWTISSWYGTSTTSRLLETTAVDEAADWKCF